MKLMSVSVRVSVRVRVSVGVRVRLRVTCSEVPTRRFVDEAPRTALSFAADLRFHCIGPTITILFTFSPSLGHFAAL